jgi:hypothetical protein
VAVNDDAGRALASFMVEHSAEGFDKLVARLRALGEPGELTVAIERPDGRLVDRLLEAGHPVVAVSPNAIKAWREGEVVSGAKSDPGDAAVIAEYLRLRFHLLKPLQPFSDHTLALRAVVRARGDLVAQRTAAHNQLEATLDAFWPGAKEVFSDVTCKIALAFLRRYPTPASAAKLGEKQMAAFCKKHGYSGVVQLPSSSSACAEPRQALPPSRRRPPARLLCWPTSVSSPASTLRSRISTRRWPPDWVSIRTERSSLPFHGRV